MKKLLVIFVFLLPTACSAIPRKGKLDYNFGFSAYKGGDIFLVKAIFNGYRVPAGAIGCCVGYGGASSEGFANYPSHANFVWLDVKTGIFYKASLVYPDNIAEIADGLSEYYWLHSQKEPEKVKTNKLITSITADNYVVSWVANAIGITSGLGHRNTKKRDIVELARAKGVPFVPEDVARWKRAMLNEALNQSEGPIDVTKP